MENRFYKPFDLETLPGKRPEDYRSPFQVDRDRIIHSSFFRRLQSKTQVFRSGEYDFYRTRLTHSIEVAQIGRSICHWLRRMPQSPLRDDFFIDPELVEAVCLAHDLGHPPFGHAGERRLNHLMRTRGGFEGNAQTLRIATELLYQRDGEYHGMSPTRAFTDGVLKYKRLWSPDPAPENHFLYPDQQDILDFALGGAATVAPDAPDDALRSIECQIMDWADDTAYCLHDIIDGVRAGFLTLEAMERWARRSSLDEEQTAWLQDLRDILLRNRLEAAFSSKIGAFIRACRLQPAHGPLAELTHRHAWDLAIDPAARREAAFYKRLAFDLIFESPPLQQMEFKGGRILDTLFHICAAHAFGEADPPLGILPEQLRSWILAPAGANDRYRRLCDYLAGLTDGQVRRLGKRLLDPDYALFQEPG
ncbi:MAG: dNTP triphosphohydrolase [Puniceicoccaceae bacterium]|nr:MAG: dNTP triphosphohydrolase [Puniceicoccaceae bacterium]